MKKIWTLVAALFLTLFFICYFLFFKRVRFTGKEKYIVVLPFVNRSPNKGYEYFSEGITDGIITQLNKVRNLKVVSLQAAMGYKGTNKDISQIASELHVSAVLQGAVLKSGDLVKINVRLFDVSSGKEIWSSEYDRHANDIFSIQTELTTLIAEQLNAELTPAEKNNLSGRPTQNLEAYDQYLRGRYYYGLRKEPSLRRAIGFFNQAVLLDSGFSRAYSGIADCYAALGYGSYELPSTAFLKAEAAAVRALQLDSTLAEPHTSLGYIKFYYYWDWNGAEQEFLKAIRLAPQYVQALDSYGYFLTAMERFPEARMSFENALQLDPLSQSVHTDMGFHLYYSRQYDQAIQTLQSAVEIDSVYPLAHLWLGRSYQEQKKYEESIQQYKLAMKVTKGWPVTCAAIGNVYGISGQKEKASKMLDQLMQESDSIYVTPYGVALVYAGLNEKEKAFAWLEKAYAGRSNWLVWLKLDPRWSTIRDDKRFAEMVSRIGLTGKGQRLNRE